MPTYSFSTTSPEHAEKNRFKTLTRFLIGILATVGFVGPAAACPPPSSASFDVHQIASTGVIAFRFASPGVLTLRTPRSAKALPNFELSEPPCGEPADVAMLERTARHLILAVLQTGGVSFRFTDDAKSDQAVPTTLTSRFVQARSRQEARTLDLAATGLWDAGQVRLTRTVLTPALGMGKTELEEFDPNPGGFTGGSPELIEVVTLETPERWSQQAGRPVRLLFQAAWTHRGNFLKTELEEFDPNPGGLVAPPDRDPALLRLLARFRDVDGPSPLDLELWNSNPGSTDPVAGR